MGKRKKKAKKPPTKKSLPKLDTIFDCPFCANEKTVEATIDRRRGVGFVACRICGAQHSSKINVLEDAVDVYAAWIDETVKVNVEAEEPIGNGVGGSGGGGGGGVGVERDEFDEDLDEDDGGRGVRRGRDEMRGRRREDAGRLADEEENDDLDQVERPRKKLQTRSEGRRHTVDIDDVDNEEAEENF